MYVKFLAYFQMLQLYPVYAFLLAKLFFIAKNVKNVKNLLFLEFDRNLCSFYNFTNFSQLWEFCSENNLVHFWNVSRKMINIFNWWDISLTEANFRSTKYKTIQKKWNNSSSDFHVESFSLINFYLSWNWLFIFNHFFYSTIF